MKTIQNMSKELSKKLPLISSFDNTRILVFMSRIYDKPYTNHRLELKFYSVRYKSQDKMIYIYPKEMDVFSEDYDFDELDTEFEVDFSYKLSLCTKLEQFINRIYRYKSGFYK